MVIHSSLNGEKRLLGKVTSCAVVGLDGPLVDVKVDVSNGQTGFTIVGLPNAAVQESLNLNGPADPR